MALPRTSVIGVFPSREEARAAAAAAQRAGADPAAIRLADREDRVRVLEAEMQDEVDTSLMGPGNVGPFTKEMQRAILPLTIVGLVVGAVLALPLAAIHFADIAAWGRVLIVVVVGAAIGAVVGFQFGGAYGARRPEEKLAGERGVTIAIDDAPASAVDALRAMHPIRLDAFERNGRALRPITTDEDSSPRRVVEDVEKHLRDRRLEG
jgi:hypothetical protein